MRSSDRGCATAGLEVREDAAFNLDRALAVREPDARRRCCSARISTPCATPENTTARSACSSRSPSCRQLKASGATLPVSRRDHRLFATRKACATRRPISAVARSREHSRKRDLALIEEKGIERAHREPRRLARVRRSAYRARPGARSGNLAVGVVSGHRRADAGACGVHRSRGTRRNDADEAAA